MAGGAVGSTEFLAKVEEIGRRARTEAGGRLVETLRLAQLVAPKLTEGDVMWCKRIKGQVEQAGAAFMYTPADYHELHAVRGRVDKAIEAVSSTLRQQEEAEHLRAALSGNAPEQADTDSPLSV